MTFDVLIGGVPRYQAESAWAWRLARRYARSLPARRFTELRGARPLVADLEGESSIVLVQADPEAYFPAIAARRLISAVERGGCDFAVPVTNEPESDATRCDPPFLYQTPTLLDEAAAAMARSADVVPAAGPVRSSVFAARREALLGLPPSLALDEAVAEASSKGGRIVVDRGAYLHRYGLMDAQAREDLAARIPPGARSVLDVGCSNGATAPALRSSGVTEIFGIEPDAGDAAAAALVYDRVLAAPLEGIREEFPRRFDAILFGDVLEHLENPAAALDRVRPWLNEGGAVIASVPNVGHWSVIADLIEGRFDYVPYSILSGTHVRFFTRRTLVDLFEACGFAISAIDTVRFPPSPLGEARLAHLRGYPGASTDLDVVEFLAVAGAARG